MSTELVPLKRVAWLNPETLGEDTDPGLAFRYIDIAGTGRGFLTAEPEVMSFADAPSRARRLLRKGDTILSTVRTYLRAVWTLREEARDLVASTGFVCLRPTERIDPRFLGWLSQADTVVDEVVARSVGVSYPAINPSDVGLIKVPLPSGGTQRAIADYLDREAARIDALISAKRRMVELLEERWSEVLDAVIWSDVVQTTRLMHLVDLRRQIMYGIVLPGPDVGGDGIAIVKGGDVAQKRLSWIDLCKTSPEIEAAYVRARLRGGDLVFAIRGGIGDVELVPDELTGANITQDVARVAPRLGVSSDWLLYALKSPTVQVDARRRVRGATITGLNIWELERLCVPLAPPARQQRDVLLLREETRHLQPMRGALEKQLILLQERRNALITAAVMGQLDIPEAA